MSPSVQFPVFICDLDSQSIKSSKLYPAARPVIAFTPLASDSGRSCRSVS